MTKAFPWITSRRGFHWPLWPGSTYRPYEDLDLFLDLIPAAILCHCRNIRRLDHFNIGVRGRNAFSELPLMWKSLVDGSITFPNLESAHLVASYLIFQQDMDGFHQGFGMDVTAIVEAFCFINRAPNLRHLSLAGFSTESWAGEVVAPPTPLQEFHQLSSLELYYCAWLSEIHLNDIIVACPRLTTFKFTSEASPTTGRATATPREFAFVGPARVLKALRPRSGTLTAISIRYMPILDGAFRMNGNEDTDEHLIRTLGDFPNLRILQISHNILQWKVKSDGSEERQLVKLVQDCPRLESLDITQIDIRKARIRPQLEGLIAAIASMNCTQLLKGIRVSLDDNNWGRAWTRKSLGINATEIFEKEHLDIYQHTDLKLLIDYEDAYENFGTFTHVHEGLRHPVTLHPGIVRVSGLNFQLDNQERAQYCDNHEIPEDITLSSLHWPRGTKALYGVLPDGTSTEYYINEKRKLVVMHRDYGPWGFGLQVQGTVLDGLTVVE